MNQRTIVVTSRDKSTHIFLKRQQKNTTKLFFLETYPVFCKTGRLFRAWEAFPRHIYIIGAGTAVVVAAARTYRDGDRASLEKKSYFCNRRPVSARPENISFMETNHIYPIFDRMLARADKEKLLGQRGVMLWFTGLSGSGKSTVAIALERELHRRGLLCRILDGDNIRTGINANLGFSADDRRENIRRIAEVAKLFVDTGIITLAAFISPTEEIRSLARGIIGEADFKEIYMATPLAECERRDVKGLYARARKGEIKNFTGISAPFEAPRNPALRIDTSRQSLEESVGSILRLLGIGE